MIHAFVQNRPHASGGLLFLGSVIGTAVLGLLAPLLAVGLFLYASLCYRSGTAPRVFTAWVVVSSVAILTLSGVLYGGLEGSAEIGVTVVDGVVD